MKEVLRFDFNGSSGEFRRTPQGFLRVQARLTKTGVFKYHDQCEYRGDEEVFRADSLGSIKGAPVTDLHPLEEQFINPANAKQHMVGITESIEREGPYLKRSLIIFHEDAIKAIESGERKEISLGYTCHLDRTPGLWNSEPYDAVQRNIIVNHVALGPKGCGRAGPDCSIRTDSHPAQPPQGVLKKMTETVRLDGLDIPLTPDSIMTLYAERKRQFEELRGRFDAVGLEIDKQKAKIATLEDPAAIEAKVQSRLKLVEKCRHILGDEISLEGKTDEELKLLGIKKFHPDIDLSAKDQSYIDGMFDTLSATKTERNDYLTNTRQAIFHNDSFNKANQAYDRWVEQAAKMWSLPLTGHIYPEGGR